MTIRVLIAEDAPDVAAVVAFGARITWPGCRVTVAKDGDAALREFEAEPADLVVLDVAMPAPDGFDVCRRIRETSSVPILMLSVHDATVDKVRALDLGADDYLTKPFDHLELVARLRALVRRTDKAAATAGSGYSAGDLSIDFSTHEVRVGGDVVHLTSTEYRLLEVLARHAGSVLPSRVLLERVWGAEWVGDPGYVKVFIRRLRQKLGDDADRPRYIHTEWGIGYRLSAPTSLRSAGTSVMTNQQPAAT